MGAYANNFLIKSNDNKIPAGGTETWDRLQILREPVKSPQLVLQKGWLYIHSLSATVSPLSARPSLVPNKHNAQALAVGTRGFSASEETLMER